MKNHPLLESLEMRRFLAADGFAIVRGNVFRDADGNGVRNGTEAGQPNIRVYLDYNNNGTRDGDAEPIALTNSLGSYRFENARAPETIAVRLLLDGTGFTQTRPAANAARTVTTTVGGNYELESFGINEPIVPPPVPPAATVLTGIVYTDRDRNGTRGVGELGRANVAVYLDNNNNGTRDGDAEPIVRTNAEGRYRFENVTSGTKTIRLLLTGTNLTQTQPANGQPVVANVVSGQVTQAAPFGVAEVIVTPPPATTAIVRGNVFYDTNQNAQRDQGEDGRAKLVVYLDLNNDATRGSDEPSVLTNTLGQYQFNAAPVRNDLSIRLDLTGTPLKQTLPTNNAARTLATVAGHTYVDQNFGVHEIAITPPVATGTLRGRVFNDVNHNGRLDDGDAGVPNRSVYIDLNHSGFRDEGDRVTLTNAEGRYTFTNLRASTYNVRLYRGDLTQTSPPNNGSNVATLTAGGTVGDLNFGTYRTPTAAAIAASKTAVRRVKSPAADVLA